MSKLILITGISKGLGYAMAEGFIQQGHTVIGCARSSDAIDNPHSALHNVAHIIA
ncbi:MAG: SDR family NAD(P)-dependent oxidoreductase [Nostoc sp.]|uniref:SDR family NAD(P)-dependent oxidoreductase n=1 Tax=Nostoc sp. TaxID=1180 RepID=UPI002FF7CD95